MCVLIGAYCIVLIGVNCTFNLVCSEVYFSTCRPPQRGTRKFIPPRAFRPEGGINVEYPNAGKGDKEFVVSFNIFKNLDLKTKKGF